MEFRLTYAGRLLAHKGGRSGHVHDIRQEFHKQLKILWNEHPVLKRGYPSGSNIPDLETTWVKTYPQGEYKWKPIVTEKNGLICALEILMLRKGPPGKVWTDIDNRLKTLFDALRIASPDELQKESLKPGQSPFYVLLEDDHLITRVAVTSDMLLEPVERAEGDDNAVRLVINVTVRPYKVMWDNVDFVGS